MLGSVRPVLVPKQFALKSTLSLSIGLSEEH